MPRFEPDEGRALANLSVYPDGTTDYSRFPSREQEPHLAKMIETIGRWWFERGFTPDDKSPRGVVLNGPVGSGKTTLLGFGAATVARHGVVSAYMSVRMMDAAMDAPWDAPERLLPSGVLSVLDDHHMVTLDDVGVQCSARMKRVLSTLIDKAQNRGVFVAMATNLDWAHIVDFFGDERDASRLMRYSVIEMTGLPDRRE